ncbi:hypothetical protein DSM112329_00171 [Paraconexibacter sp. AEG42_29]|uniref:Uncharacterized protein n=1 Tax=Paraconexibacter sp. AEG42_29 TaxID=2997339 RepID=A0AAU7ANY7_9ACTN
MLASRMQVEVASSDVTFETNPVIKMSVTDVDVWWLTDEPMPADDQDCPWQAPAEPAT